jgi:uncharacterized membrane protein YwzB
MNATALTAIIAWVLLISSWIVPFIKKGNSNYRITALIISAISFGMFVTNAIYQFF